VLHVSELEQSLLQFCTLVFDYNCVAGMTKLIENVETVVRAVLGGTSLKDSMTSADIRDLVCEVRRRVETQYDNGSTTRTAGLYRFMLPDSDSTADDVAQVRISLCSGLSMEILTGV